MNLIICYVDDEMENEISEAVDIILINWVTSVRGLHNDERTKKG